MSQEVKRIRVFRLSDFFCPRGLLVADESPMPDHNSELLPVTEHDRIVAELKAENEILKSKASQFESTLKETMRVRDAEIERLKRYTQHRVDCICRAGVLQYANECDCGLDAIEKESK